MEICKKMGIYPYLLLVFLLNGFDLSFTMYWFSIYGAAIEANPIIQALLLFSPLLAISLKMVLSIIFCIVIIFGSKYNFNFAFQATRLVLVIYSMLACWHTVGFILKNVLIKSFV